MDGIEARRPEAPMTLGANARIAGFTFLFYIVAGIASMIVFGQASGGEGIAGRLAEIGQHAARVGITVILDLLQCFSALVLAVTLYAITRAQDRDLAKLGLLCRVAEGLLGAVGIPRLPGLLWLAASPAADPSRAGAVEVLGAYLLRDTVALSATFFAAGSTLFSWLLLRGRMIPRPLAVLGVGASVLILAGLPLQLAGFLHGPITALMWLPMVAFEVPLGLWLLIKGVAKPAPARAG